MKSCLDGEYLHSLHKYNIINHMKQQLTLQTTHQHLNLNHTSQENLHIQPTNNQQQEQEELQTKTDKFNRNENLVEFSVCKQIE